MSRFVRTFWKGYLLLAAVSATAIFFSSVDAYLKFGFALVVMAMLAVTRFGVAAVGRDRLYRTVFCIVVAYLWFAYPFKAAYLAFYAEDSWVKEIPFLSHASGADFVDAFFVASPGLVALVMGMMAPWKVHENGGTVTRMWPSARLFLPAMGLLLLKVALQLTLDIGKPGVLPKELGIPFLTGILAFMVGFVLVCVVNIYLFLALREGRGKDIRNAAMLVAALVLTDLWVGYKQALVFQVATLLLYLSMLNENKNKKIGIGTAAIVLAAFVLVGVLYKYVNNYRYALLAGEDISSAVSVALAGGGGRDEGTLVSIFNRINGVENFFAAVELNASYDFGFSALFDQSLGGSFNDALFGGSDVVTQFGLTQFGALYVIGGWVYLVLGAFLLGAFINVISRLILNNLFGQSPLAFALAPLVALWFVKVLFAGGVLLLYAKELSISMLSVYLVYRLSYRRDGAAACPDV